MLAQSHAQQNQPEPQIVGSILLYADEFVKRFVSANIPQAAGRYFAPHDRALGVIRNGRFCGGVVFHDYTGSTIFMSGAFDDPRWALPGTLRGLFAYPFETLKVETLLTATGRKNKRARKIDEGLGFELVGMIRHYWGPGVDCALYQMPRVKCRWLRDAKPSRPESGQ
jgi:RimJ/RimL family protein N-acetyltransferase